MATRKGLGKGLDSMIPDKVGKITKENAGVRKDGLDGAVLMNINKVEPNRKQPRKSFEEEPLQELAESVKQYGVLQPLIVQKQDDYYEIIAGERRWRAAKMAGLKEIPVIIRTLSEQERMEISLIENIQREDLNPIEEARAYKSLLEEFHLKQEEVADRVAKSRTAVTNAMRLLKLDERVQEMLIDGSLTTGHARALLAIEEKEKQFEIAQKIVNEKLTVRDVERLVKKQTSAKKKETQKPVNQELAAIYRNLEEQLKISLGTKVSINYRDAKKGKLEIEYYTPDELDRIVDLLRSVQK